MPEANENHVDTRLPSISGLGGHAGNVHLVGWHQRHHAVLAHMHDRLARGFFAALAVGGGALELQRVRHGHLMGAGNAGEGQLDVDFAHLVVVDHACGDFAKGD